MAFKGKIKNFFSGDDEKENGTEEGFYDLSEAEALKEAQTSGSKMILLEPRSFSEARAIADNLKKRDSVVVNLKRVTSAQAKRIIDFLSGCIYAISGNMQKIGVGIYLCTPKNVNVQGTITDDADKGQKGTEDELDW